MNAAQLRGLGQALALDHRPGVIEPFLLLAQMRRRRLGQRIEGAPTALGAKPKKSVRAAPTDDLASRAMRTSMSHDALDAGRSQRVLLTATLASLLRRSSLLGPDRARLPKAAITSVRCPSFIPEIADSQAVKILSLN
jgi:hypothetical protein